MHICIYYIDTIHIIQYVYMYVYICNRYRPSHDASEKRRPNRVEPRNITGRTELNRHELNRTGSFLDCGNCMCGCLPKEEGDDARSYLFSCASDRCAGPL